MATRVSPAKKPRAKRKLPARRAPIQQRSTATVAAILEATTQILAREGLAALTTNAIAERAGISVGSLYQYFSDKQAVLEALVTRHAERVQAGMLAAVQGAGGRPVLDSLAAIVRALIDAERLDPRLSPIVHQLLPLSGDSPIDRFEADMERLLAGMLAAAPDLRPRDPELAAAVLVRATSGALRTTARRAPDLLADPAFARELTALLRGYLLAMSTDP